jgi:hypothetical protein
MPRSRVVAISGLTPVAPTSARSRVVRITGDGAAAAPAAPPRSRIFRVTGSGAAGVAVAPLADITNVEPESTVTLTAALVGGGTADSWTWRRVSGANIGIASTGATVTFPAPSDINGTSVVVGVRATVGGIQSPEATCNVTVLPQLGWWWDPAGWIPAVTTWA